MIAIWYSRIRHDLHSIIHAIIKHDEVIIMIVGKAIRCQRHSQCVLWLLTSLFLFYGELIIKSVLQHVSVFQDQPQCINILIDSFIHGSISGIMWVATIPAKESPENDNCLLLSIKEAYERLTANSQTFSVAFASACILDIDHFISASSWTVYGATHLSQRPFGHSVLFAVFFPFSLFLFLRSQRYNSSFYWLLLCWNAIITHQLRDAIRRGLWLWSTYSTPRLSPMFVSVAYLVLLLTQNISLQNTYGFVVSKPNYDENKKDHFEIESFRV